MPIITVTFLPEEQTSPSHIIFGSSYGMAAVFKKYELYKFECTFKTLPKEVNCARPNEE
jgi:hypothetical protein